MSERRPVYPPLTLVSTLMVAALSLPLGLLLVSLAVMLGTNGDAIAFVAIAFMSLTVWLAPVALLFGILYIWSYRGELERVHGLASFLSLLVINAALICMIVLFFYYGQ